MANSIYQINKGINQAIEFKGLKAQYIGYLGAGLVVLLILFAGMYSMGIPSLLSVGIILISGSLFAAKIYRQSNTYGEYGLMKALAAKRVPKVIKSNSRQVFLNLKNSEGRIKR